MLLSGQCCLCMQSASAMWVSNWAGQARPNKSSCLLCSQCCSRDVVSITWHGVLCQLPIIFCWASNRIVGKSVCLMWRKDQSNDSKRQRDKHKTNNWWRKVSIEDKHLFVIAVSLIQKYFYGCAHWFLWRGCLWQDAERKQIWNGTLCLALISFSQGCIFQFLSFHLLSVLSFSPCSNLFLLLYRPGYTYFYTVAVDLMVLLEGEKLKQWTVRHW